jgi:hypothetical protein
MIIVGIEGCSACKIAKNFLPELSYIELKKGSFGNVFFSKIKRALLKMNPSEKLPVVFNDTLDRIVDTDFLMNNLNVEKIRNKLQNQ